MKSNDYNDFIGHFLHLIAYTKFGFKVGIALLLVVALQFMFYVSKDQSEPP